MKDSNGLAERDGLSRRFALLRCEHAVDAGEKAASGEAPVWWVPRDEALEFARQEVLRATAKARALLERSERVLGSLLAEAVEEPTRPLRREVILPPPLELDLSQLPPFEELRP